MKKKLIVIVLAVTVIVSAAIGATIAYFSATATADNIFTVGNVKVALSEEKWNSEGKIDAKTVYPGEPLAKDPVVTNEGANPCVVRIKVDWPFAGITYRTQWVTGKLGNDWIDGGDGYFYYLKPLKNPSDTSSTLGVSTTKLFEQVVMPTTLTNDYRDPLPEYNIKVNVEAVQAQGIFTKWVEMADGISETTAPPNGSPLGSGTELELVKKMFLNGFGH